MQAYRVQPALRWDLRLSPVGLETAFWEARRRDRALSTVDAMSCITIPFHNIVVLAMYHIGLFQSSNRWLALPLAWPTFNILSAAAQTLFRLRQPDLYSKYRTAISYGNVIQRIAYFAVMDIDADVYRRYVAKQVVSRPAWVVVIVMLLSAGPVPMMYWHFHFPLSFRSTVVLHALGLVANSRAYTRVAGLVLRQPNVKAGVLCICSFMHSLFGNLLLMSKPCIKRQTELCTDGCWIVQFMQFLTYSMIICHAYLSERSWKVSFLKDKGILVEDFDLLDRINIAVLFAVSAYLITLTFPLV